MGGFTAFLDHREGNLNFYIIFVSTSICAAHRARDKGRLCLNKLVTWTRPTLGYLC